MSRDLTVIELDVIEGEVVPQGVVLSAEEMCSMNFARLEFERLAKILMPLIDPLLFREDETACAIARHIEQVRIFSRNFCWQHRHLGAAYGVVGKRPGDKGCDQ